MIWFMCESCISINVHIILIITDKYSNDVWVEFFESFKILKDINILCRTN